MAIEEKREGDVAVLYASGSLIGGDETAEIHQKVKSLIEEGVRKIIIDFAGVSRMNSLGIGILMACYTSIKNAEGALRVTGAQKQVYHLFEITQIHNFFSSYHTVNDALKSFS